MLEFIALSLLLLIPLVYLVVTVSRIQAGAFAAESAAGEAARTFVVTGVHELESGASRASATHAGQTRAQAAVGLVASDFGFTDDEAALTVACAGTCLEPGTDVTAEVTMHVTLPGIPGFLSGAIPLEVEVVGSARSPVDSLTEDS
ncbi:pilus assembly protein [Demequina sp. TTPB684]|uniref:pilus assembly protein n=1 Tax=unclassified Demequina TaxID=2620311 RepID=UPI001CF290B7|nr:MULTISPECIES: pilus assembly protein [unclassified Demequina]MCB2413562.1 pilus assembly protein [Demequina sp. TTPB684]UPU87218.1 pilus assembly protein [Demequina sp. TMPB413]